MYMYSIGDNKSYHFILIVCMYYAATYDKSIVELRTKYSTMHMGVATTQATLEATPTNQGSIHWCKS